MIRYLFASQISPACVYSRIRITNRARDERQGTTRAGHLHFLMRGRARRAMMWKRAVDEKFFEV
jgi:hypothetical protein